MPTITGYTAERMKEIEDSAIVNGAVILDNLILTRFNGTQLNAGNVRGPQGVKGDKGDVGDVSEAPLDGVSHARKDGLWVPSTEEAPSDSEAYERKDGTWVSSQWIHDLLSGSIRELAWVPSIAAPHTILSSDAAKIGPLIFAQAELRTSATSTVGVSINLPEPAPNWRAVGWTTSFGVPFNKVIGTFRTSGGGGESAALIHPDGSNAGNFTDGDILSVSLVYFPA